MLRILSSIALSLFSFIAVTAQVKSFNLEDIHIRDPYILPDADTGLYYLYRSAMQPASNGKKVGGVECFKSSDLKTWTGPYCVCSVPENNWITGTIWAPEVHKYNGKYYLFATLNSDIQWKKKQEGWPAYTFRGVQVFVADNPEGPFLPFSTQPLTPMDEMTLDGTLYVENGEPYMVYCHEWVQTVDGEMCLVKLKPDLSATEGNAMRLFNASSAKWSTGRHSESVATSYVTDGCFLYTTKTGKLLMIWSSFYDNDYAIGIAESTTGRIAGPWKQQDDLLFSANGGHGMIFRSFDGELFIVLHGPNKPAGAERAHLFPLIDDGNSLRIKQ